LERATTWPTAATLSRGPHDARLLPVKNPHALEAKPPAALQTPMPWSGAHTRLACRLGRPARALRTALGETPRAARETRALPGTTGEAGLQRPRPAFSAAFAPAQALQHAHAAVFCGGELERHDWLPPTIPLLSRPTLPAVLAHDALHDHQAEAGAAGLGRVVGLEEPHQVLRLDASAGVAEKQVHVRRRRYAS